MAGSAKESKFVVCLRNDDCEDLERGKVYQLIADARAGQSGYLRVIDESGEDYLYPQSYFSPVQLPLRAKEALTSAG